MDVFFDDVVKFFGNIVTAQGERFFAVDEHRRCRRFTRAGQADADVGVLALARPVDDATHDRHFQPFDTGVLFSPNGHLLTQKIVDFLRQFLEGGAGGAAATGTGGDTGHKGAQPQGLQNFGGDQHLLGAGFAGLGLVTFGVTEWAERHRRR